MPSEWKCSKNLYLKSEQNYKKKPLLVSSGTNKIRLNVDRSSEGDLSYPAVGDTVHGKYDGWLCKEISHSEQSSCRAMELKEFSPNLFVEDDKLLDSALEVAGQVAGSSVSTSPLPYNTIASQCESLGTDSRKKLSN